MRTLHVDLGERSYPIYIGENLLGDARWFAPHIVGRRVAVISNETVAPLYLETLLKALQGHEVTPVVLPDGEAYKQWETLQLIFDALLKERHDRKTTLIALGGGVIGDMAGFAAACYQRGVNFIQVPTTLLSQVDSSVGGKTGINHPLGKNMIGAFYQPQAVVIDTASLKTLPSRELSAGLAEVIKYGFICDEPFITWLEAHMDALLALEPTVVTEAIERSCAAKARVVGADERESGVRATLNLGHTFGHAIETQQGYGVWLHGRSGRGGNRDGTRDVASVGLAERRRARSRYPSAAPGWPARGTAGRDDGGRFYGTHGRRQESARWPPASGFAARTGECRGHRRFSP